MVRSRCDQGAIKRDPGGLNAILALSCGQNHGNSAIQPRELVTLYNINRAQWVLIGRRSRSSNNCVAVLLAVPQNSHVSRILPRPRFVVLCLAPFTHYRSLVLAVTAAIRYCWLVGVFPALHATHDTVYALVLLSRSCAPFW